MKATFVVMIDKYPCTLISVSENCQRLVVQRDYFYAGPGHTLSLYGQKWVVERDLQGEYLTFKREKGVWRKVNSAGYLLLGRWEAYREPEK
jgi:hypothetical protein